MQEYLSRKSGPGLVARCAPVVVALVLLALTPTAAHAQTSYYPGSSCQDAHPTTHELQFYSAGNVENTDSAAQVMVVCPLVKTNAFADDPAVTMWVHDGDSTDTMYCYLFAANSNASSTDSDPDSTGTTTVGGVTLTMSLTNHMLGADAKYNIVCWMDEEGSEDTFKIYGYKLEE